MTVPTLLVDINNHDRLIPQIVDQIKSTAFTGLDCETQDDARHPGLMEHCGYDVVTRKKAKTAPLVFDMRRTVMTGFSVYPENDTRSYYVNLNHADVPNRVPWKSAKRLLDALPKDGYFIAHNAPFELTAFKSCYGYEIDQILCTLQMAVSAHGPDEYDIQEFVDAGRGSLGPLIPDMIRLACLGGFDVDKNEITNPALAEIAYKIISKEASGPGTYNGFVKDIAFGYGLKKLVKMLFGHQMTTFEEVLGDKAHMGQLTGAEVANYGADDAYWVVPLFRRLLARMPASTIPTFFAQENPMVHIFSGVWTGGIRVNLPAIGEQRARERNNLAVILRELKGTVRELLPFPAEPHPGLMKRDAWYVKNWARYRKQVTDWANSPDADDALAQVSQVRGPVTNAWRADLGLPESNGINLSHYMPVRTLIYDLTGAKAIVADGKTESDKGARGKLIDRLEDERAKKMILGLGLIAGVEQVMKLYLTPYTNLTDPETSRIYPVLTSMLATRRMGMRDPNGMQLAKRGESTYVRGFYLGDVVEDLTPTGRFPTGPELQTPVVLEGLKVGDEHLVGSCDWSGIELVIIGELSDDPQFFKAFGQIPHEDMHTGAAVDILSVDVEGLTEDAFKGLKRVASREEFESLHGSSISNYDRLFTNFAGQPLSPGGAAKFWRTEVGKGANFNYWFSGWLATIGERMGWNGDKTKDATDRYRARFAVAEEWRVDTIRQLQMDGYLTLPDGHRRTRHEATQTWMDQFRAKFDVGDDAELRAFNMLVNWIAKKIQKRAFNQGVNAMIQGTCATMAKRSAIKIWNTLKERGWDHRIMRFMMPVHDELVYSVHPKYALEGMKMVRDVMITHPDLFKNCKVDASPSLGLTFEPYDAKKAPFGQIELFEAPPLVGVLNDNTIGKRLNDDDVSAVINYLSHSRHRIAA